MRDRVSGRIEFLKAALVVVTASLMVAAPARAGENPLLVSVNATTGVALGYSLNPSVSETGRYVLFESREPGVVPGVGNGFLQVYVRDMVLQETEVVSVSSSEELADADCVASSMTPDARYVSFNSQATNLGGGPGYRVRDRQRGTTVSLEIQGGPLMLSDDGQLAVIKATLFGSNGMIAVKHMDTGVLEMVSVNTVGQMASAPCNLITKQPMSSDGRYVIFTTDAWNLAPVGFSGVIHVYVRDRVAGTTRLVSVSETGVHANDDSLEASISPDGRYALFHTQATNLVPLTASQKSQIVLRDLQTGAYELLSVNNAGEPSDEGGFTNSPRIEISGDNRFVSFTWVSLNLVPDLPTSPVIFTAYVRDRLAGLTWVASVDASGQPQAVNSSSMSRNGRGIAFQTLFPFSSAEPPSQPIALDVYIYDRFPWSEIEPPLAGAAGEPRLVMQGAPEALAPLMLAVTHGLPGGVATLVIGLAQAGVPFKGGVLVPVPAFLAPLPLDAQGLLLLNTQWPAGIPAGTEFFLQAWMADPSGPQGFTATNGVANAAQ